MHEEKETGAAPAAPAVPQIPDVLFDGHAVYQEVLTDSPNPPRTSANNVAEVLDAVVRLMRKAAPAVTVSPAPRVEDRDDLLNAVVDAANAYLEAAIDPGIMVGLKDRQTFVGIGTKATFTMMCDGRSGRQLEEAAHLARQAQPTDRDAVLEEAVKACEALGEEADMGGENEVFRGIVRCIRAIRALKGKSGEGAAS